MPTVPGFGGLPVTCHDLLLQLNCVRNIKVGPSPYVNLLGLEIRCYIACLGQTEYLPWPRLVDFRSA